MEILKVTCLGRNGSYSVPKYHFSNVNIMNFVIHVPVVASGFYLELIPRSPLGRSCLLQWNDKCET